MVYYHSKLMACTNIHITKCHSGATYPGDPGEGQHHKMLLWSHTTLEAFRKVYTERPNRHSYDARNEGTKEKNYITLSRFIHKTDTQMYLNMLAIP